MTNLQMYKNKWKWCKNINGTKRSRSKCLQASLFGKGFRSILPGQQVCPKGLSWPGARRAKEATWLTLAFAWPRAVGVILMSHPKKINTMFSSTASSTQNSKYKGIKKSPALKIKWKISDLKIYLTTKALSSRQTAVDRSDSTLKCCCIIHNHRTVVDWSRW